MNAYEVAIPILLARESLSTAEAAALMADMIEGLLDPPQVAAVLTALSMKGETADELAGLAAVMRRHALSITAEGPLMDTCGTGGSGLPTINTSTLVAFVAAAEGVKVAKHGNRASSGSCGSMDVLEALGVNIELTPAQAEHLLREGGLTFMYARRHHPALGQITPVRRALGFRTTFNFLGPICNPAGTTLQMMGVSSPSRAPMLLDSLRQLGAERAMIVCGHDGLDEISLCAPTQTWELRDGETVERTFDPREIGIDLVEFSEVVGGSIDENAAHFMAILEGRDTGPRATLVALNAGAALYVAGRAESIAEGVVQARAALESLRPLARFEAYRQASRGFE